MSLLRVIVLISGNGSNLQALIDAMPEKKSYEIVAVVSNKPDAYGLERAKAHKIPTAVVESQKGEPREAYDQRLQQALEQHPADLYVLAGFMRILSAGFVEHHAGKIINIHPSLLPKHKGLNTHQRALDAGDTHHGVTVHYVTAGCDEGPIIAQMDFPIEAHDTAETLQHKAHTCEHQLYPSVVHQWAMKRAH